MVEENTPVKLERSNSSDTHLPHNQCPVATVISKTFDYPHIQGTGVHRPLPAKHAGLRAEGRPRRGGHQQGGLPEGVRGGVGAAPPVDSQEGGARKGEKRNIYTLLAATEDRNYVLLVGDA